MKSESNKTNSDKTTSHKSLCSSQLLPFSFRAAHNLFHIVCMCVCTYTRLALKAYFALILYGKACSAKFCMD